ncbi:myosin-8-like [Salvia hispanica]|uniref:myosin-8-like n=1 Tax=Salvia hispanica TaxID=49212 RepID=UPI0020097DA9|nr:myosin-8-like [Salvia hispanica]
MTVATNIAVGSHVWVEDLDEAWLDGVVVEVNGEEIKVNCTSGKTAVANAANVYPQDLEAAPEGVDDMTKLSYLHEPGVLYNLKCRYNINEIYTYTGNILIAVNPFQRLPHLYNDNMMEKYKGMAIGELSPHPYAIADNAYRQMIKEDLSQAILVSGESGAGKTESTKSLMTYLAYMGGSVGVEGKRTVEQQVLESSPVLEAFGNAKTVRNNNSSRFGKFVEIQFNNRGRISGAAIRTYLLERSRVCQVSDPERNYHCFYMLCAAPAKDVEKFKLGNPRDFRYLNQSNCYELDGVDDSKEYLTTRRAMDIVGISPEEQDGIFRVVAAILHMGNIEFGKGSDGDASHPKDDQSLFHLKTVAELLMCDEQCLEDSLCKRIMVTRDETITKSLSATDAAVSRDALAKIVYSRLFDWLVDKINHSIGQDSTSKLLIGLLDIYGFESFKTNSFEQFCINLTNEKLQQHFNQHVFKMEQEEYTKEEIDWSYIEFVDNQDILDLIERKPGGIIALLDEACILPRSTHETFAEKLYQTFKDHKRFTKPKLSRTGFTICHYAGDVTYQTELFLDKNKDYVILEHQNLLSASSCSFISSLFPPLPEDSSKSSKFSSIGSRFKQQLQSLLETLSATEPHYVRCIKPNNLLKPSIFENGNVLQQLRCGGVMEAIRISCAGYPTRKTFQEFINRFKILEPNASNGSCDEIAGCKMLLQKANLKGYQIGKTKVFLRAGQMAELDSVRNQVLGISASVVQNKFRSFFARKNFLVLRVAAIQIQALSRGQVVRCIYERKKRKAAATTIQKSGRMFLFRKTYTILLTSAIVIQAGLRAMVARNELIFRRRNTAAILIQRHCRGYLASHHFLRLRGASISMQCACRVIKARKELRLLKMAAKETGALQEAKEKLEKKVEELTLQLELEKRQRHDIEEAKNREIAKLLSALEEIRLQLQDTSNSEALKKVFEQVPTAVSEPVSPAVSEPVPPAVSEPVPPAVSEPVPPAVSQQVFSEISEQGPPTKEGLVIDTELVRKLTSENEKLKSLVSSLEKKVDEEGKKYEESNKLAMEAEIKIIKLKTDMQRLEEKISDMETADQVLRRQALMNNPSGKLSGHLPPTNNEGQNGQKELLSAGSSKRFGTESNIERQRELVDTLITCIKKDVGFSEGKPVAALTIYKCLLNWKSFEAERTNVFDMLIHIIGSALEDEANNDRMAYWLCNTSTLLFLLQRTLKSASSSQPPPPTSFFGRMAQTFRASPSFADISIGGVDGIKQVEAKYPGLLFKEQLTAYIEKIYSIIRDNAKKELSPVLSSCIEALKKSSTQSSGESATKNWQSVIDCLNRLLSTLKDNFVPPVLVQKIFEQLFSYINVQLFNSLLLQKECCTFNSGEYVKTGLTELQLWYGDTHEYAGSSFDELKYVQQAVRLLIMQQKSELTYDDLTTELCPILSSQQLYRICILFGDDNGSDNVPPEVISNLKILASEDSNDPDSSSYVLDDNSSIPLPVEDLSNSLHDGDFKGVKPPEELLENPSFEFLQGR